MTQRQQRQLEIVALLTVLLLSSAPLSFAGSGDENWDGHFGVPGPDGYGVGAVLTTEKGVYVGGSFISINGVAATNIARFEGKDWLPLGSGLGRPIVDGPIALTYCRGWLYAAGTFTNAGTQPALNVARWDGTNWSSLGSGIRAVVSALATDGTNVFVGGSFTNAGGVTATNIARWDGAQWWPLGDGVKGEGGDLGAVDDIAVDGSNVYVGGPFGNASGVTVQNIARWDGTNWHTMGSGIAGRIRALTVRGSEVYAGGDPFRQGNTFVYLSKWDGAAWRAIGTDDGLAAGDVETLALCGSDIYAGGGFVWMNGVLLRGIAKWDGANWSPLGSGVAQGAPSVLACTGTELFVGGSFAMAGGKPSTNIALWHIPHSLSISETTDRLTLSWPATGTNFVLEAKDEVTATNWSEVSSPPALSSNELVVTQTVSSASQFYRLRRK